MAMGFSKVYYNLVIRKKFHRKLSSVNYPLFYLCHIFLKLSHDFFSFNLRDPFPQTFKLVTMDEERYRRFQIEGNVRKFKRVDSAMRKVPEDFELALSEVVKSLNVATTGKLVGVCHGVRSGLENSFIESFLPSGSKVYGTDISPTVEGTPNGIQLDFHNPLPEWVGAPDFIYSNSLDQSINPQLALSIWLQSLKVDGRLFIHLTRGSGRQGLSNLDPFALEPELFPYYFLDCEASNFGQIEEMIQVSPLTSRNRIFILRKSPPKLHD